jgi:hypothetical protein
LLRTGATLWRFSKEPEKRGKIEQSITLREAANESQGLKMSDHVATLEDPKVGLTKGLLCLITIAI